jgi:hypothetical protein
MNELVPQHILERRRGQLACILDATVTSRRAKGLALRFSAVEREDAINRAAAAFRDRRSLAIDAIDDAVSSWEVRA